MFNLNKVHRPHLPVRKPVDGDKVVTQFITSKARDEESDVILTTEPDLFHVMTQWLDDKKHKYVGVRGGYVMQEGKDRGKFVEEDAVRVPLKVAIEIWKQGWIDTQESVLHIYHKDILGRYRAELVFINDPDRESIDLGIFAQTTKERAFSNTKGYTYQKDTGNYYMCVL